MTDDLIRQLMSAGLSKQQATSVTAETLVHLFMDDDSKLLIHEAKRQLSEMQDLIQSLQKDYNNLKHQISALSDSITAVSDAQNKYGEFDDEKARTVIAL